MALFTDSGFALVSDPLEAEKIPKNPGGFEGAFGYLYLYTRLSFSDSNSHPSIGAEGMRVITFVPAASSRK